MPASSEPQVFSWLAPHPIWASTADFLGDLSCVHAVLSNGVKPEFLHMLVLNIVYIY